MSLFSHRRQLRRWAARMLLVWLFGLVAGVAHACIVDAAPIAGPLVAELADGGHGDEEGDHAKANCVDFRDKVSSSARGLQSALDAIGFTILAAPTTAYVVTAPGAAPVRRTLIPPDRQGETSITIAFLRLAL